jgi:hypothetical protein
MSDFGIIGELDIAFSTPNEFGEIALAWLDEGVASLANAEHEDILSGPPLKWDTRVPDSDAPQDGPPAGSAWGMLILVRPPLGTPETHLYSKRALTRLRKLAPVMESVDLNLSRINDEGLGEGVCNFRVSREGQESGFARLIVEVRKVNGPDGVPAPIAGDHRCLALMRRFAERFSPVFGHVSFSNPDFESATALEVALKAEPKRTLLESDTYLRGYSWLTVVPETIAVRLGGAEALRRTGAFVTVDELPGGSIWLLATHAWDDYQGDRIEAVFDALTPALPAGMPQDPYANSLIPVRHPPLLLSWRDAGQGRH